MNYLKQWITPSIQKIGFEDIKYAHQNSDKYIFINTLPPNLQQYLIKNTIPIETEEKIINNIIDDYETKNIHVFIYGKNSIDDSSNVKANQLLGLGFTNVYVYSGGLFEWLLLQDVYGKTEFPIIGGNCIDILKYRPEKVVITRR